MYIGVSDAKINEKGCFKDSSVLSIQKDCAIEALDEAGLNFKDIDGLAVAGFGECLGLELCNPMFLPNT